MDPSLLATVLHSFSAHRSDYTPGQCAVIYISFCLFVYSQVNFSGGSLFLPQPPSHTNHAYLTLGGGMKVSLFFYEMNLA